MFCELNAVIVGFSSIFPIKSIKIFSLDELYLLFGNADEDWSRESKPFRLISVSTPR